MGEIILHLSKIKRPFSSLLHRKNIKVKPEDKRKSERPYISGKCQRLLSKIRIATCFLVSSGDCLLSVCSGLCELDPVIRIQTLPPWPEGRMGARCSVPLNLGCQHMVFLLLLKAQCLGANPRSVCLSSSRASALPCLVEMRPS